ncbi:MAG: DUF4245 domain-containing protein [Streptosporangiaceae bacterium]
MNKVLGSGLSALGCLLAAAVVVVTIPAPHAAEPVTVSYRADQDRLARLAPYPAVAPHGLPASWQPVSSGLTVGGANGAGTVTWALDYMTPDGLLASLEETNAVPAAFVRRMTNSSTALPPSQQAPSSVNAQAWSLSATPARGQRSMYRTSSDGVTLVVTGNATWAELRQLAASLRPVLRPPSRPPSPRWGNGWVRWCRSARPGWSSGRCRREAGRPSTSGAA